MYLKQYYLGCLAHASYLIADETSGSAIVVDPQRDIQQYLTDAAQLGVQIRFPNCSNASMRCRVTAGIAVHCAGGYRSSIAASLLNQHGITNRSSWRAASRHGRRRTSGWSPANLVRAAAKVTWRNAPALDPESPGTARMRRPAVRALVRWLRQGRRSRWRILHAPRASSRRGSFHCGQRLPASRP